MRNVGILEIGEGNLLSISSALNELNIEISLIQSSGQLDDIDALILPGVGAFAPYMKKLRNQKLLEPLKLFATKSNKPVLGICVGMHVMFEQGEENGITEGLGLIEGNVQCNQQGLNIGYRKTQRYNRQTDNAFDNFLDGGHFYFTHGYNAKEKTGLDIAYNVKHNGTDLLAFVKKDNIFGCQFHPELSGVDGVNLLKNILYDK